MKNFNSYKKPGGVGAALFIKKNNLQAAAHFTFILCSLLACLAIRVKEADTRLIIPISIITIDQTPQSTKTAGLSAASPANKCKSLYISEN